mmetsp:Transcript_7049/g.18099  ORF Transcript_7049/g.18099 Transcript_7049/m.18099 type:complete len:428 (+) Transcript_7049:4135-5418(+)
MLKRLAEENISGPPSKKVMDQGVAETKSSSFRGKSVYDLLGVQKIRDIMHTVEETTPEGKKIKVPKRKFLPRGESFCAKLQALVDEMEMGPGRIPLRFGANSNETSLTKGFDSRYMRLGREGVQRVQGKTWKEIDEMAKREGGFVYQPKHLFLPNQEEPRPPIAAKLADRMSLLYEKDYREKMDLRLTYSKKAEQFLPLYIALADTAERDGNGEILYYRNPLGATGIRGNGHLWMYGPNTAGDCVMTKDTTFSSKSGSANSVSLEDRWEQMQIVLLLRADGWWACPGGMRMQGESFSLALLQEFVQEATVHGDLHEDGVTEELLDALRDAYQRYIFRGVVSDPRCSDTAWMETHAAWFHVDNDDDRIEAKAGDPNEVRELKWINLKEVMTNEDKPWYYQKLFASHNEILETLMEALEEKGWKRKTHY